ncbi:2-dehydropantoate 2-reductase [Propionibacteriaceae bacterium ES.041]|uniref:2-dehydropantoate 2-reductase n=1 Tax=Enemella evansiae TaxID=2016499 RepID=UPI000B962456|nr:2-dehydropantoate 2-reductase [Enemella evansiae]OYO03005.1 2-dehydropantoate 2-reductase [Enemella evansiae]PFG69241.1 2-dehydropantoate 2-reductase [Propionibacteriaceae bacterium ES.041]
MRFAVVGAGSLGGYFGGLLQRDGHQVSYLARGRTLETLRENGLRITGQTEIELPQVTATDDPAEIGPVDAVLLCVKTPQLDAVLPQLPDLVGPLTAVITMQNGVDAPRRVAEVVGEGAVLPGIVRIFTQLTERGVIDHRGGPGSIAFSEPNNAETDRLEALRDAFSEAGVTVVEPADIWSELWQKYVFFAPSGLLGALTAEPVGVIRSRPGLRELLQRAIGEAVAVGRAAGIDLPPDVETRTLAFCDQLPEGATTSLQRDLAAGVPSELESVLGALVRLAAVAGVPVPLHELGYEVLAVRAEHAAERAAQAP